MRKLRSDDLVDSPEPSSLPAIRSKQTHLRTQIPTGEHYQILHLEISPSLAWDLSLAILANNLKDKQAPVSLSHSPPALQPHVFLHSIPYVPYMQSVERNTNMSFHGGFYNLVTGFVGSKANWLQPSFID